VEPSPASLSLTTTRYPVIDVLRAFAALAVVACHCVVVGLWPAEPLGVVTRFARYGWLGVDLFFVISGFVITNAALKLRHLGWRNYFFAFWVRRVARIVPLYYVTLVAYLILINHGPIAGGDALKQIGTHLLLIHQWWPDTAGSINPVTWTLGIEVLFYLVAWTLVGLRVVSIGRGAGFIALTVGVSIGYRLLVFQIQPVEHLRIFWSNQVFGLLDGFMLGTAIAVWRGSAKRAIAEAPESFFLNPVTLMISGLLLLVPCLWVVDSHIADFWHHRFIVSGFRTLTACAFGLMVLAAVRWQQSVPVPQSLEFLGKISYGIYLWHLIILLWLQKSANLSGLPLVASTLSLTFALSTITYYLVELPGQRWGSGVCRRWPGAGS
jgi:peptidoglycan/LPS O-acetylase OafA/YrhL